VEYVELGWSDLKVSRIGLGTWQFSETWGLTDYEKAKAVVAKAVEVGINFFDTAMVYGRGMSETFLGKALKELGVKREEVVIATKIPGEFLQPDDVFKAVDRSLKRLGVSYIDLLQIHHPPTHHNIPTQRYAKALERLVVQGVVRYLGVSNYPVALVEDLRANLSVTDIVSMQYRFNLVERWSEEELIPYAEANDLAFIPWSPLAKGALSGKYNLENIKEFKDLRLNDPVFNEENFSKVMPLVNRLVEIAGKYGKTPSQVALNWLVNYSPVIIPIPGAKTPEQVSENAGAIGWRLSYEDWRAIDELSRSIKITYVTW